MKNSSTYLVNFTECAIAQLADDSPVILGIFVELHILADLFAPQITGHRAAFEDFTDSVENGRHFDGLVKVESENLVLSREYRQTGGLEGFHIKTVDGQDDS